MRAGSSRATSPPPGYGSLPAVQRGNRATRHLPAATPGPKPSAMMRAMLTPPPGARLPGQPVRWRTSLPADSLASEQAQRVEAYWDLCSSVADYYLGVREQEELQRLRTDVPQAGAALPAGRKGTGRASRHLAAGGDGVAISPGQPDGARRGQPAVAGRFAALRQLSKSLRADLRRPAGGRSAGAAARCCRCVTRN